MADPRIAFGLTVEPDVQGPFEVRAPNPGSPSQGGTLDCAIVARTADGRPVVIGEIWAACPGPGGTKVRIDALAVAHRIVEFLNRSPSTVVVDAVKGFADALDDGELDYDWDSCREAAEEWLRRRAAVLAAMDHHSTGDDRA